MKKHISIFCSCIALFALVFISTGCKKTTDSITTSTNDANLIKVTASDEMSVTGEIEQVADEAVAAMSISSTTSNARIANLLLTLVPGAVIDTSRIASGIISVDYYGKDHDTTKLRSGTLQVKLPVVSNKVVSWKNAGTTATLTLTNYEIRFLKNNTSVWMQGSLTLTNFSGGLQKSLVPGDSVVEKLRGQVQYSDNDNNVVLNLWSWNLHTTRVVGMAANNDITITTRADTNVAGYNNVVTWGAVRFYPNFYTSLNTPVFRDITGPNFYNPLSGIKLMNAIQEPITITMGVDASGRPVVSGNPYGFRLNWIHNSTPDSAVAAYY